MNAADKENHKKRNAWIQATMERERRREEERKAEAQKKPLTLEEADAMHRHGDKIDFDKYHLESFQENFVRHIYENTTVPEPVKQFRCSHCGIKVRKLYGERRRCAECLIKGL